jgi:hypothetical protein
MEEGDDDRARFDADGSDDDPPPDRAGAMRGVVIPLLWLLLLHVGACAGILIILTGVMMLLFQAK